MDWPVCITGHSFNVYGTVNGVDDVALDPETPGDPEADEGEQQQPQQ